MTSQPTPHQPPPHQSSPAVLAERRGPRRWAVLAVLMLSLLMVVVDNTILNIALKTLASPAPTGLGATQSQLQWAVNAYTLVFAGLLFTAGQLGDRLGRRRILIIGMAIFALSSTGAAYAGSPGELITARAVMGLGAALVMPATLAIVVNVFDRREQPKAIGIWATSVGLAIAIGPATGGLLLEHYWWGSVFLINVPVAAAALTGIALLVPESRNPRPGRLDPLGVTLSVTGLVLVVYGVIRGGQLATFHEPLVAATTLSGLAVLVCFVLYERRISHPALDVGYFRRPAFAGAVTAVALTFFALMGMTFLAAFYLQSLLGYSPLSAGLLALPLALAQVALAPTARLAVARYGARAVCVSGLLTLATGISAFALFNGGTPPWAIGVAFLLQGIGIAYVVPPVTVSVMRTIPPERAGSGSAINGTFREFGAVLGVAVLGALLSVVYRAQITTQITNEPALPAELQHEAAQSLEGTLAAAAQLGAAGQHLIAPAQDAFIQAVRITALGATGATLLAAAVVLSCLPGRQPPTIQDGQRRGPPVGHAGPPPEHNPATPRASRLELRGAATPGTHIRRVGASREYGQVRAAILRLATARTRRRGLIHEDPNDRS